MDKEYKQALEIAKTNLEDVKQRGEEFKGVDALAYIDGLLTPQEIAERDLRVAVIHELIKARRELGISQQKLGELSGIKQPAIARFESGTSAPQLDTIIKVLYALGKTLKVVPLEEAKV